MKKEVGVLAMQGAFAKHIAALEAAGAKPHLIKTAKELNHVDALIIPGGESTTMGLLLERNQLLEPIRDFAKQGKPILGTCAGMILLAKEIENSQQVRLGLMDIHVARNAFGRQIESFEQDLEIKSIGKNPIHAVFIRAPFVTKLLSDKVEILGEFQNKIVCVRQNNLVAAAFHPELTQDLRFHQYFIHFI